jgi:FxsC-like protein
VLFFFLSYARGGDENDKLVEKFYLDLSNEVRNEAGEDPGTQVGFLDMHSIQLGARWSPQLVSALAECRMFLALCSPRYFNSHVCGQEWTIFEQRLRRSWHDAGDEPPLLLPIIWWQSTEMHPVAAQRQYAVSALEPACQRDGLRQLMRLSRYRDVYKRTVSTLANHIVTQARANPMQPLLGEPRFDNVPSAFSTDNTAAKTKSQFVHFIVAAGTDSSMTGVRRDVRYYGETALQWAPYKPDMNLPIAQFAVDIAEQDHFNSQIVDGSALPERLRMALRHNQIVVLLADVWAARLNHERDHLLGLDDEDGECERVPRAVLVPGNHADSETQTNWRPLKADLVTVLPTRLVQGDVRMVNLGPIRTPGAFEADLRVALQTAQHEAFRRGTVHGRVDDADESPRPVLTVSDQPSDPGEEA